MRVLGIETSCDETGIAIFDDQKGILSHQLYSQVKLHADYGGVVPELASRVMDVEDYFRTDADLPQTIGHLSAFMGNAGVLLRAYYYARALGREGMLRVGEYSSLAANYMLKRLQQVGYTAAYPERRASHEFILTLAKEAKAFDVSAMDVAKRLLDYNQHAPTTYFPLLVPECWLIEPTETETIDELDAFIDALVKIREAMIVGFAPRSLSSSSTSEPSCIAPNGVRKS